MKTIAILLLFASAAMAQTEAIKYTYDDAGNRIIREVIYLFTETKSDTVSGIEPENDTVKEEILGKSFSLYPNPVKKTLALNIENYQGEKATIQIFSTNGALILERDIKQSITHIYVEELKPAIYLMKLVVYGVNKKYIREYKIIKQ